MIKISTPELIDNSNDSTVADEIFCRIGHLLDAGIKINSGTGNVSVGYPDLSKISPVLRAVYLSYDVLGIVLNGGFNYLFEADYAGDPGFVYCAAALRQIGCKPAFESFADALALFPNNTPPLNPPTRIQIWNSAAEKGRLLITHRFWDAKDDLIHAIAVFIRKNRAEFDAIPTSKYA